MPCSIAGSMPSASNSGDRLEGVVTQCIANQRAEHRAGRLRVANHQPRLGWATHIGASITSGITGKMIASKKLNTVR